MEKILQTLAGQLDGELLYDQLMRVLYATDASVYRELPLAVALPKHAEDIQRLLAFANQHQIPLIPRAAGTSLAGQCVGAGIVVDVSKYMNRILEINTEEGWVSCEPGVVRDELNKALKPHALFFGPNTSTANRCMIGGMVGNNSCGTTSIVYGSTREHVMELETLLSNGEKVSFGSLSNEAFKAKQEGTSLEAKIYQTIDEALSQPARQQAIRTHFPKPEIHRRNTGYAVDYLLESAAFTEGGEAFNFCKLLCGSEGTLAFTTRIKLHVNPLPPPAEVVVAIHFDNLKDSLKAVPIAMSFQPDTCELMDKVILDCTKGNREQQKNRFFLQGDPEAVLAVAFKRQTQVEAEQQIDQLIQQLQTRSYGYAFAKVYPPDCSRVWELRKAGLGLLANLPGDPKAVACIEDTAVAIEDLPDYIDKFAQMMEGFGQKAVYYAHAGAGELHLRPILNLKQSADVELFHAISEASARLVKKYRGSLSGEHGDGRVRAEFIPMMIGEDNYEFLRQLKKTWDPDNLLNPGKIVDAPPMNSTLRYEPNQATASFETIFDFSETAGFLRAAEKCNGSGDCRKLPLSGGTMCPSYQATRNEKDTTRARANALREFLTRSTQSNRFYHEELRSVMDLCLGCKGCTSECPSNVDMASMKSEFLHQYYQSAGIPFSVKMTGHIATLNALGAWMPSLTNYLLSASWSSGLLKKIMKVAPERQLPAIQPMSLRSWFRRAVKKQGSESFTKGKVYFFCDEFTNYNDSPIGVQAVRLLWRLGYEVLMPQHANSGRAQLSKGLLPAAKRLAQKNVDLFADLIDEQTPLLGLEPSAILGFRDEFPRLVKAADRAKAKVLGEHALMIEEFLVREVKAGRIDHSQFDAVERSILLHGHCHQKALSSVSDAAFLLSVPEGHSVEMIPSGCCGMAGSFGYEQEHYEVSMQVGELVLFPAVRGAGAERIIAAAGTSCRHQIADGTDRKAVHPVELLWKALKK